MHRFLFTIGFTGKTAEEFFALLRGSGVEAVIDVRQNRTGQLSAFAKHPDLAYFLKETAGIAYRHEPLLAPTPELRKKYQSEKKWDAYEAAFLALLQERGVPNTLDTAQWPAKVAFLCTEAGPEKCHRRLAADVVAEHWRGQGDEVTEQHLVSASRKKATPAAKMVTSSEGRGRMNNSRLEERLSGVALVGWAAKLGSRRVPSEEVDRAFGMPLGKLRERAGIDSLSYATAEQNELTLGDEALRQALHVAGCAPPEIDWIIVTSETHREYPSLAARVHKQIGARERCGALDVGGACLGLLNALASAQALLQSGHARTIAVVTADVHSRSLSPRTVPGEFGGLFGDGASAFVLRSAPSNQEAGGYALGDFVFGCASQYSEAIRVADAKDVGLAVQFDGEALSRAAISSMARVVDAVEQQSGIAREEVGAFATHQPNPRLVTLLARQCGVAAELFPAVSRINGNLGSSTCGVALTVAAEAASKTEAGSRKTIFLASLGPGLLFGGGWLTPLKL